MNMLVSWVWVPYTDLAAGGVWEGDDPFGYASHIDKPLGLLDSEDGDITLFWNVGNYQSTRRNIPGDLNLHRCSWTSRQSREKVLWMGMYMYDTNEFKHINNRQSNDPQ
jgi:hypothetical protein